MDRSQYSSEKTRADEYDTLTGLPGMNRFFGRAESQRQAFLEQGEDPALIYFDFNGMKEFNIRYGFAEGDKLILAMSQLLLRYFERENCSRFGGDRFAAVTVKNGLEEKLRGMFDECEEINEGRSLPLRAGIYLDSMEVVGAGLACDRARLACDQGRDSLTSGYWYFSEKLLEEARRKQYIIDHLDQAIEEHWIKVYYQPLIRSANGRVCDEEALARWIDPEKGFLSPADFIPILENAGLIYKLDLYITEQILAKMKLFKDKGLFVVPASVNISRSDFDACDVVEEIRKRVDATGIAHEMLTIEITESILGNDLDYMKQQVDRFHALGFKVWMDDYGSGYSSPDILMTIPFDTIKLDMQFIRQYEKNKASGIIISGLIKMAIGLGIETVVEGVETEEQAEFLKEVGCTKLQGYHYCKPIPLEEILRRYETSSQIGFEDPAESAYFSAIGRVNLYDLSIAVDDEEQQFRDYFNTMPMAIVEIGGEEIAVTRCNKSYRSFIGDHYPVSAEKKRTKITDLLTGPAASLVRIVIKCAKDGRQVLTDFKTMDRKVLHLLIRRIAINPVTQARALVVIVLGVVDEPAEEGSLSFAHVARALSSDYINLYYVNLENGHFIEYQADPESEKMSIERRGRDFFANSRRDALDHLYEEDRGMFVAAFTKENVLQALQEHGMYTITYRLLLDGKPVYVNLRALYIGDDRNHIIIAVSDVDAQMRQQEAINRLKEERVTFSRISALAGEYICFYAVDPETDHYYIYNAASEFKNLAISVEGDDFFGDSLRDARDTIAEEDLAAFEEKFNRKSVLDTIEKEGVFAMNYHLLAGGKKVRARIKAALVEEDGKRRLIFGVISSELKKEMTGGGKDLRSVSGS